jgi:beta-galactosidase/beta-glucuronidase
MLFQNQRIVQEPRARGGWMTKKFDPSKRQAIKLLATGVSVLSVQKFLFADAVLRAVEQEDPTETLAGEWSFALDEKNEGIADEWFNRGLAGQIKLPASTDQAGKGTPVPDAPQKGQPQSALRYVDPAIRDKALNGLSRPFAYTGPAWYERAIVIPAKWKDKQVSLFLERCLWETRVWVDGQPFGRQDSLSVPHLYDLGALNPGRHRLVIRVDNSNIHHYTDNTHAYSEMTQTIWNGIVGEISLRALDPVSVKNVQVFPDLSAHLLRVHVSISNKTGQPVTGTLNLHPRSAARYVEDKTVKFSSADADTSVETELKYKEGLPHWDEFSPSLCSLTVSLASGACRDRVNVRFGVREMGVKGTQFTLNKRPTFLRGTHDAAAFPLTGYPAMDLESWRRIYQKVRAYGLNHVRYHTCCPPEAAFSAADEVGIMLQVELPAGTVFVGSPQGIADRDAFYAAELDRILDTYGNHPSFCLFSMGNEFRGGDLLNQWVKHGRDKDPRHLYTSTSNPEAMRRFLPGNTINTWSRIRGR